MVYTARILSGEVTMYTSSKNANTLSWASNCLWTAMSAACCPKENNNGIIGSPCSPPSLVQCCAPHLHRPPRYSVMDCHRTGERKATQRDTNWPTLATLLRAKPHRTHQSHLWTELWHGGPIHSTIGERERYTHIRPWWRGRIGTAMWLQALHR